MDNDNLVNAEHDECAALLAQMEAAALAGLNSLAIPDEWAITARYFAIAALLRLASSMMATALTEDPDVRHHARYEAMLVEVYRRIAPWSDLAGRPNGPSDRMH